MDVFSNLPEPIIHHIMSFLPTTDATHMSILSKTFHSSWRSFPIMDFDYRSFQGSCKWDESYMEPFFDFIVNSLQRRMMQPKTNLEGLRFCGFSGHGLEFDSRIRRMINFAIENNVRELKLQFPSQWSRRYFWPPAIFSANSIKILTLKDINSVSHEALILSCPCIENFNLINCSCFETVIFASNAKLKAIRIARCRFDGFHFESPALCLESFSYVGRWLTYVPAKFNISSSTTPNLKHLLLISLRIPDRLIESEFAEFRYLETLKIKSCSASKKLMKFHLEYLKTLEVCLVDFDKVIRDSSSDGPTEIDISSGCTKLKHLEFRGHDLPLRWIRDNFSEFRFIETLKLQGCSASKKIKFQFECLKTFELHLINVDQIETQAPSMVSFTYGSSSSYSTPPEIDISSSYTNLKHLRFHGVNVPDIWVDHNFSQFLSLETLELHNCSKMKKIKLRLEYLKSLMLKSCGELSQVEIEAPNLVSISYERISDIIYAPQVIITSKAKLDVQLIRDIIYAPQVIITSKAKLDVQLKFLYGLLDDNYYISLRNVIDQFAPHCQTLTLRCVTLEYGYGKELIYPGKLRNSLVPPLYNLKHLKVEIKSLSSEFLVELIDSLLWLAPHPNTISFIEESQVKSLKFHYRDNLSLKRWRKDLEEVTMEDFMECERTILQNYFSKSKSFNPGFFSLPKFYNKI